MTAAIVIFLVIALCSVVHSIFGVGLLVFGTPTFLLLGYSYPETLWIVLPPSIAINLLQLAIAKQHVVNPRKYFFSFLAPTLAATLFSLTQLTDFNVRKLVGAMLVISALTRFSGKIQTKMRDVFQTQSGVMVALIGLIHGLTNMGGGLLTSMMGTLHSSKEAFRANVAFGYLLMAMVKVSGLLLLGIFPKQIEMLPWNLLVAIATYTLVGGLLFRRIGSFSFQHAITALIFSFGILLLV